jgi:hypothetical protein
MEKQRRYRKHPDSFHILNKIPSSIGTFYRLNKYEYIEVPGFGKIPIAELNFRTIRIWYSSHLAELMENDKTASETEITDRLLKSFDFTEYANGFFDGYNSDFATEIGTPESKKEAIMRSARENQNYNPIVINRLNSFLDSNLYDAGYHFGKHYKAWEIIFETPGQFVDYFANLTQTSAHDDDKNKAEKSQTIELPDGIKTNLAEAELIEKETLRWIGEPVLCAYFVYEYFSKKKNYTCFWKIGEKMFGVPDLSNKRNSYLKNKHGNSGIRDGKPKNHHLVDRIIGNEIERERQRKSNREKS